MGRRHTHRGLGRGALALVDRTGRTEPFGEPRDIVLTMWWVATTAVAGTERSADRIGNGTTVPMGQPALGRTSAGPRLDLGWTSVGPTAVHIGPANARPIRMSEHQPGSNELAMHRPPSRSLGLLAFVCACSGSDPEVMQTGTGIYGDDSGTTEGDDAGTTSSATETSAGTGSDSTSAADTSEGSTSTGDPQDSSTSADASDDSGDTEPVEVCECAQGLDDGIFVLSDDAELWKFTPDDLGFEMIGDVSCNGQTSTFSMAVDRLGFAWIMFQNNEIWRVDITDTSNCIDPGYEPGQMDVDKFGMAFVSQDAGTPCDKLYGNTWDGTPGFDEGPDAGQFIVVEPSDGSLTIVGSTDYNGAELTGTGDGRAFMFAGDPAKLVEMDKDTGQEIASTDLGGLTLTNAFAFAFFEGDFYFFTEANGNASRVTKLETDDGSIDQIVNNAPLRIVGAGVSTCVAVVPQ